MWVVPETVNGLGCDPRCCGFESRRSTQRLSATCCFLIESRRHQVIAWTSPKQGATCPRKDPSDVSYLLSYFRSLIMDS